MTPATGGGHHRLRAEQQDPHRRAEDDLVDQG